MVSLKKTDMKKWFNQYQKLIGRKIKRYTWTTLLMTQYLAMRGEIGEGVQIKPDIIIAGIPVWNISRLGHAVSDEILKYRSMGGIFLAHQKGGKQTFKFTARIFGPMRFITYKLLEALQLLGSEEGKNVMDNLTDITDVADLSMVDLDWDSQSDNVLNVQAQINAGSLGSPIVDYTNASLFSDEEYAFHRTFPIITDSKIYTDMYLETLIVREDIKYGKNVMEIECAFRQYTAPLYFQKATPNNEGNKKYYSVFVPREALVAIQRLEGGINLFWAGIMTYYYSIGELKPDVMYQKPFGKREWQGIEMMMTMVGHYALSRMMFPKNVPAVTT